MTTGHRSTRRATVRLSGLFAQPKVILCHTEISQLRELLPAAAEVVRNTAAAINKFSCRTWVQLRFRLQEQGQNSNAHAVCGAPLHCGRCAKFLSLLGPVPVLKHLLA